MTESVIANKSKLFASRIVKLYKNLTEEQHEYVLSKQLLRSGTSIGANVKEAGRAQSHADFYSKMSIALKEASETEYWIELLLDNDFKIEEKFPNILEECKELIRILMAITKTAKSE